MKRTIQPTIVTLERLEAIQRELSASLVRAAGKAVARKEG